MSKIEFSINLTCSTEKLFALVTNFEGYSQYFEQIQNIKMLEKKDNEVQTEEVFSFKSLFDHTITQKSLHKIYSNQIHSEVIDGPFKGTIIDIIFEKIDSGTKVNIIIDYNISLKYKILSPIIKQKYKIILTGLLYKMNNKIMLSHS